MAAALAVRLGRREALMGGLAALAYWDGRPCAPGDASRLLAASSHRAPDGVAEWTGGSAALGHQRFITTSEQRHERQPLVDHARSTAFVFDGRLDNRGEVATAVALHARADVPDAALAFAAFLKWGADAPRFLLGDFAFVAWDWRERRLVAARDHMGVRHLHFGALPNGIVFATDMAQVLAHADVPRDPNPAIAADYLASDVRNVPGTLYRAVSRVPAGHVCIATPDAVRLDRFWAAEPGTPLRYHRDDDYAERCRELLVRAVDARLRSDRRTAAMLSGGLDSSSVVTVAHRLVARPGEGPRPFSMVFPDRPDSDEQPFIDAVAERCGVDVVRVVPGPVTADALRRQAQHWNGTPGMPADEMAASLYAAIHAHGHRVTLTGAAGDFLFTGSVFQYADLLRAGRPIRALRRFVDDWRADDTGRSPLGLLQAGAWPLLPGPIKRRLRPLARRLMGITDRPEWLRLPRPELDEFPGEPRGGSYATEDVTRLLSCGMHFFFVECAERAAAQAGVELRHPFLDARLVQFALDIPDDQRKRGPYTKYVLRRALAGELAEAVRRRRTKAAFGHSIVEALEGLGGETFFRELAVAQAGWVDAGVLGRKYGTMMAAYRAGRDAYGDHIPALWMVAAVELWFRAAYGFERAAA